MTRPSILHPRTYLVALLCAIACALLTSCQDEPADPPASTVLPGVWYYDYSTGQASYWGNSTFTFNPSGYGYYYGEDQQGYTDTWAISWQSYGGRQLTVWFDDGTTWNFDYGLNGYGQLWLSPWDDPGTTLYYTRGR